MKNHKKNIPDKARLNAVMLEAKKILYDCFKSVNSKYTTDNIDRILNEKSEEGKLLNAMLTGLLTVLLKKELDEMEMKYRATRFAHECGRRGIVTNNDRVNLYEELYDKK